MIFNDGSDSDTEIDTHSIAESINSMSTISHERTNNKYTKKQCSICEKQISALNYSKHQKVHNKMIKNVYIVKSYFQENYLLLKHMHTMHNHWFMLYKQYLYNQYPINQTPKKKKEKKPKINIKQ